MYFSHVSDGLNFNLTNVYDMLKTMLDRQNDLEERYNELQEQHNDLKKRFENVTEKLKIGMIHNLTFNYIDLPHFWKEL